MKKLLIILAIILLCRPLSPATAESEHNALDNQKINLGAIVPLTGPLAFFGQDYIRAYDLAVEAHPEIKNKINIIWEDSAYDSKQAVSAFNKLVSLNKADIIYSFGGPMLNALAPIAEAKKIPFFATESAKEDCKGREYCSLFRNEEDEWGKATWKMLRKEGKKKIGIVKNQNQFMNTFVDAIIRNKNEDETVTILLDVPPETADFRTNVIPLKSKDVDALGIYLLPISHRGFLSALNGLNQKFHLFGVEEFLVNENNKGFENVVDGTLVVAPGENDSYKVKFESKYGFSAGFFYTPAFYDFLDLLKDTVTKNKNLRGIDLVNAMHFSGERLGVSGKYSVKRSESGVYSYSFPIFIYKVSGEKVTVDEVINF